MTNYPYPLILESEFLLFPPLENEGHKNGQINKQSPPKVRCCNSNKKQLKKSNILCYYIIEANRNNDSI